MVFVKCRPHDGKAEHVGTVMPDTMQSMTDSLMIALPPHTHFLRLPVLQGPQMAFFSIYVEAAPCLRLKQNAHAMRASHADVCLLVLRRAYRPVAFDACNAATGD